MSTTKAAILALTPDRVEAVAIPGAGTVYVHAMSELERASFEAMAEDQKNKKAIKRLLIMMTVRATKDREAALMFNRSDLASLGEVDSAVTDKLASVAMKVCGIGDVDLETLLKKPEPDSVPMTDG